MNRLKKIIGHARAFPAASRNRGAITVEYALGMMVAAFFMLGIFSLFQDMSLQVLNEFKQYVLSFPNI